MKYSASSTVALLVMLLAGCAPPPPPPPAAPPAPKPPDAAAMQRDLSVLVEKGMAAIQARDAAAVAGFFADDATWILPDASTYKGRADIEKGAGEYFKTFESITVGSTTIDKLVPISDTEALTFTIADYTLKLKGKKPESHRNPFADYWKKGADGAWRIAYEVNADGVVHAAAAKP
jgi:uncharacterized protein (TIGR02246 family)